MFPASSKLRLFFDFVGSNSWKRSIALTTEIYTIYTKQFEFKNRIQETREDNKFFFEITLIIRRNCFEHSKIQAAKLDVY